VTADPALRRDHVNMAPAAHSQRNAAEILGQAARNPGQFGVLAGADRAQVNVQAEQPSRQDRCLGYGLINVGRRGREYGEREATRWLDRIHAPRTVGEYDIWAVQPDSTGLRDVTQSPADRSDYYPAWGRRLAPGSASPARLLSNVRDNVTSPAVPHDNDRR
jgi:hypothetical protein